MKRVQLEDKPLIDRTFEDTELIYRGGPVTITNTRFVDCAFVFEDAAANTLNFLKALYRAEPDGALAVEKLFQQIRGDEYQQTEH